jgi:hypothetical protein
VTTGESSAARTGRSGTARHIPKSVAPLVAAFELARAEVVTRATVAATMESVGLSSAVDDAVRRLQRLGWLLPLRTQGAWEFAPASRGAAVPGDCPFTELRATHLLRPNLGLALAFDKAAMLHELCPWAVRDDSALVAPRGVRRPAALSGFRWVTIDLPAGGITVVGGVPVVTVDALLYSVAARPVGVSDWKTARTWLQAAADRVTPDLVGMLDGSPAATGARLAYLLALFGREDLATEVVNRSPDPSGPVHLGPRSARGAYDPRFNVVDTSWRTRARRAGGRAVGGGSDTLTLNWSFRVSLQSQPTTDRGRWAPAAGVRPARWPCAASRRVGPGRPSAG